MSLPKINLVVVGHKDHGKSTLIGRLLYDSQAILDQKLKEIKEELKATGKKFEFAFLMDSLEEERAGGLTIDIMHTPFKSPHYFYTIIDCPGHREFIQKMLTGASHADAAVLVTSAKEGVQDQTKQHAFLIKTLGIEQLVVVINKMDQVAYAQQPFDRVSTDLADILRSLGYGNTPIIPISAMIGDNVYRSSQKMGWYQGPTLIQTLDATIHPPVRPDDQPLRAFVQDVYQLHAKNVIICKIETGVLTTNTTLSFTPSGQTGILKAIDEFGTKKVKAEPGDSVGLHVDGVNNIARGEIISYPQTQPKQVKTVIAEIILLPDFTLKTGDVIRIRYGTAEKRCKVTQILTEIDSINLTIKSKLPNVLTDGAVGEVELEALEPLALEKYSETPPLGRFVIEDTKGTVAAGLVLNTR